MTTASAPAPRLFCTTASSLRAPRAPRAPPVSGAGREVYPPSDPLDLSKLPALDLSKPKVSQEQIKRVVRVIRVIRFIRFVGFVGLFGLLGSLGLSGLLRSREQRIKKGY